MEAIVASSGEKSAPSGVLCATPIGTATDRMSTSERLKVFIVPRLYSQMRNAGEHDKIRVSIVTKGLSHPWSLIFLPAWEELRLACRQQWQVLCRPTSYREALAREHGKSIGSFGCPRSQFKKWL